MKTQTKEMQAAAVAEARKVIPWATFKAKPLLETGAFTVLSILLPAILAHTPNNQWITGTLINALLFLACWRVGIVNTLVIALIPSSVALFRGLLPAPMAVMIPYIILGNAVLILTFGVWKIKSLFLRVFTGAFLKTLVIWGAAGFLVALPKALAVMMQWPQLITALAGGLIALGILKIGGKNRLK